MTLGASKPVLCIAGPGPGVGKTSIAAGLARRVRASGGLPAVIKPIEVGCRHDEKADLIGIDGAALRAGRDHPMPPLAASPYRFATPENPLLAARKAGIGLRLSDLEHVVLTAAEFGDVVIVELPSGAGGPLVEDGCGLDLAARLGARVLLVAAPVPGVESVVAGLDAMCRARDLRVGGVLLDALPPEPAPDPAVEQLIAESTGLTVFPTVPAFEEAELSAGVLAHLETHRVLERSFYSSPAH